MAKRQSVRDGLDILAQYPYDGDDNVAAGDVDVLYAGGVRPSYLTPEDAATMTKAGWSWNDRFDCWELLL